MRRPGHHDPHVAGAGEAVEFSIGFSQVFSGDLFNLQGFDAAGKPLAVLPFSVTVASHNVSAAYGNVPLSGFTIAGGGTLATMFVGSVTFTTAPPEVVAEALIAALGDAVADLVDAGARLPGDGHSLFSRLEGALKALEDGHTAKGLKKAIKKLEEFIKEVNHLIRHDRLTIEQGEALIEAAEEIIALLEAPGCPA